MLWGTMLSEPKRESRWLSGLLMVPMDPRSSASAVARGSLPARP